MTLEILRCGFVEVTMAKTNKRRNYYIRWAVFKREDLWMLSRIKHDYQFRSGKEITESKMIKTLVLYGIEYLYSLWDEEDKENL